MLLCRDETTHTFTRPFNSATKAKTVHKMLQRATMSSIFDLSAMLGCHQEQHVQYKAEILFYI
jgi:hypothetical protein